MVALKFIRAGEAEDDTARKRLLREARAAALDHPFIAKIFDTGRMDGRTFIAMEYVEGQKLKQKLAGGRLEMKEALRLASETAEALEAAHDKGIVHRDLKPSNVIITPQGHVKVMDFGLAKRVPRPDMSASLEETVSALTKEGTTAGTLPYMSPEQLRAEAIDHRSDIFSFGIVLYEMLAGRHPFQKLNPMDTAAAVLNEAPAPLSACIEHAPNLLEYIVGKTIAKDPDRRYQTIHDVRTELQDVFAATAPAPDAATALPPPPAVYEKRESSADASRGPLAARLRSGLYHCCPGDLDDPAAVPGQEARRSRLPIDYSSRAGPEADRRAL